MLSRCRRLKSAAFAQTFEAGELFRHPLMQLRVRRRGDGQSQTRAAFVVPRRHARAAARNRLRRVARETYRLHPVHGQLSVAGPLQGCDLIFMLARQAGESSAYGPAIEQLLRRAARDAGPGRS